MGFFEDDRIRRKNSHIYSGYWYSGQADDGNDDVSPTPVQHHTLKLDSNTQIADIVAALQDAGFKVTLDYNNTIIVKKK